VWSNDLESYSEVVHLLVGCPMLDKKNYPGPPGWGFGHEANNLSSIKNLTVEKPNNGCRLDNSGERPRKSYKDNDFYTATWNVIHLYGVGMLKQVKTEMEKYRIDITAVQEVRWRGSGVLDTENFILMKSTKERNTFGTGILINRMY